MFKTYEEMIKTASFKGQIKFENRKSPLRAVRLFLGEKEITLPNSNAVIIPEEYARNFVSKTYMECLDSWGFKLKLKKGKNCQNCRMLKAGNSMHMPCITDMITGITASRL